MIRTLGPVWLVSAALSAVAVGMAAFHLAGGGAEPFVLGSIGVALLAAVGALAAAPLALSPGEALRASLSRGSDPWGLCRSDFWGDLARAIARAAEPAVLPPDPFLEMRRLAANLELTLRQTGEELAAVRASVGEAARGVDAAAAAGERLAAAAGAAERRLAEVSARGAEAHTALVTFPERIAALEAASGRAAEAAAAIAEAADAVERLRAPSAAEDALREAARRGAEQARRLEAAMPLLVEAVARLPAAAASEARLAGIAGSLSQSVTAFSEALARLDGAAERVEQAAAAIVPPDIAPALADAAAKVEEVRASLVSAGREAVENAVTRLSDIAEVTALDAAWRAGARAEAAAARIEASAEALSAAAAEERDAAARLAALSDAAASAGEALDRRAAEAAARIEAPLAGHAEALGGIVARLDAAAAALSAALADDGPQGRAAAILDDADQLLRRLEDAVAALTRPRVAVAVEGEEPISSVAERLLSELAGDDAPAVVGSLDETIRRLQTVAGAIAARSVA
jgi:hypothetical protein